MDMVTTTQALEILRGRGFVVPYPTIALWAREGKFTGAKLVETPRGPVWMLPRASVEKFEPPQRGRPPKATKKGAGPDGRVEVRSGKKATQAEKRATGQATAGNSPSRGKKKGGRK